jgi:hypothetical protein
MSNDLNLFIQKFGQPIEAAILKDSDINEYLKQLPDYYLAFLKEYGFGLYGDGIIQLINPNEYRDTLSQWLGKDNPAYLPIAFGAFGEFYYYRKLNATDEDVCMLDPAYRQISNCVWDLKDFFNEFLCDNDVIRLEMFENTKNKVGQLKLGQMYIFKLAPVLGGDEEDVENRTIGDAKIHFDILYQSGL